MCGETETIRRTKAPTARETSQLREALRATRPQRNRSETPAALRHRAAGVLCKHLCQRGAVLAVHAGPLLPHAVQEENEHGQRRPLGSCAVHLGPEANAQEQAMCRLAGRE